MSELPFPHHTYQNQPGDGCHAFVSSEEAAPVVAPNSTDLVGAAACLRAASVREIILIHGTFAGNDVLGIMRELGRFLPGAAAELRRFGKLLADQFLGDLGNYTVGFADRLQASLHDTGHPVLVHPFCWSGENNHLGRASGAIALLDYLLTKSWHGDDRILVFAHSHGGNLLAMMSHLVDACPSTVRRFFHATRCNYHDSLRGRDDLPIWERVRKRLLERDFRLPGIDVATFGTPLRYRWNTHVCARPLHFVQHRALDAQQPARALLPVSFDDVMTAKGGDYVQQLGIGGTDFWVSRFAWRSRLAEDRLGRMFARGIRRRDLPRYLRQGLRVSLDGKTLLIDYPTTAARWNQKLAGHGIYTRWEWAPFHLRQIVGHFYSD